MAPTKNSIAMKPGFVFCLVLMVACFFEGCKTSNSGPDRHARAGLAVDGFQMSLAVLPASQPENPEFEVSIRNVGKIDFSLDLGYMLANGKIMVPQKITFLLADETGKQRKLSLASTGVAGRLDDYVVPLRAGSTYSVRFRLNQFDSLETKEFRMKLPRGKCEMTAEFEGTSAVWPNRDMQGMNLMKFWVGKLRSNTISIHGPTKAL
jgi:hypothetical protein